MKSRPEGESNARKLQQQAEILIGIRRQAAMFFREIPRIQQWER
jgi:hypothetical protein